LCCYYQRFSLPNSPCLRTLMRTAGFIQCKCYYKGNNFISFNFCSLVGFKLLAQGFPLTGVMLSPSHCSALMKPTSPLDQLSGKRNRIQWISIAKTEESGRCTTPTHENNLFCSSQRKNGFNSVISIQTAALLSLSHPDRYVRGVRNSSLLSSRKCLMKI
jgi:hypothetical protein